MRILWGKRFATVTGVMTFSRQTEMQVTVLCVLKQRRTQDSGEDDGDPVVLSGIRIPWRAG